MNKITDQIERLDQWLVVDMGRYGGSDHIKAVYDSFYQAQKHPRNKAFDEIMTVRTYIEICAGVSRE